MEINFNEWQNYMKYGIKSLGNGDALAAEKYFQKSLFEAEKYGNLVFTAFSLRLLATAQVKNQKYAQAEEGFRKALKYCEKINNCKGISEAMAGLGSVFFYLKDYDQSIMWYEKAINVYPEEASLIRLAMLYSDLGNIYLKTNKFSKAEKLYLKARRICEDSSFSKGQGEILLLLGEVYFRQGAFQKAKKQYIKATAIFVQIEDWHFLANTLQHMAFIMFEKKEYHSALLYLSRAVSIFLRLEAEEELSESYFLFGSIWQCLRCFDEAEDSIILSIKYYHGEELGYAVRYQTMAIISIYKRKYFKAKEHYSEALRYYQYFGDSMKIGEICEELTFLIKYENNLFKDDTLALANLRNKEAELPKYKLLLTFAMAMGRMGKDLHALKFGWKALELAKVSEYQTEEIEVFIQELSEKIRRNK